MQPKFCNHCGDTLTLDHFRAMNGRRFCNDHCHEEFQKENENDHKEWHPEDRHE